MRTNFSYHLDELNIKRADLAKKASVPIDVVYAMEAGRPVLPADLDAVFIGLSALRLKAYSTHERAYLQEKSASSQVNEVLDQVKRGEGYLLNVGDTNVAKFIEKEQRNY